MIDLFAASALRPRATENDHLGPGTDLKRVVATLAPVPLILGAAVLARAEPDSNRPPALYSRLALATRYTDASSSAGDRPLADGDLGVVAVDGSSRFAIGWPYAACAGLDVTLGAGNTGLAYGAAVYLIGLVLPFPGLGGQTGRMSACGGFGLSGIRGSIPFGWELAGDASLDLPVGPVDLRVTGKAALIANAEERRDGTEAAAGFPDEYSGTIELRLDRRGRVLGGDPVIGMMWQEAMGAELFGFFVGIAASRFTRGR